MLTKRSIIRLAFNRVVQRSRPILLIGIALLSFLLLDSLPIWMEQKTDVRASSLNQSGRDIGFMIDWTSNTSYPTHSIAWGDADNDGDLDLAVGNFGQPSLLLLNDGHQFEQAPCLLSASADHSTSVAWGDVDNDGDLDLAVANDARRSSNPASPESNQLYRNLGVPFGATCPDFQIESIAPDGDSGIDTAWGDVNGDGYIDLAVVNYGDPVYVYLNQHGTLATVPSWQSPDTSTGRSAKWGDIDNDGDLDLAITFSGQSTKVFPNVNGGLQSITLWESQEQLESNSLAWGDYDADGDLDLAVSYFTEPARLYENIDGNLAISATWTASSSGEPLGRSVSWADFDSDGFLDLAVGNQSAPNYLYRNVINNDHRQLDTIPILLETEPTQTYSLAWADIDGDGDLDLAAGGDSNNRLYRNMASRVAQFSWWGFNFNSVTTSVVLADFDADNDLDLAVGVDGASNYIVQNQAGNLETTPYWLSVEQDNTQVVAWGDVDGDGDLDLAVGNKDQPNRLYLTDRVNGQITMTLSTWTVPIQHTQAIAWGDVDLDGDLDLAVGNAPEGAIGEPNAIYLNQGGVLSATPIWQNQDGNDTRSLAWADFDHDGDLDLAVGNQAQYPNRLYLNQGGVLQTTASWQAEPPDKTTAVAWGDMDGDRDLDLVVGNERQPNRIYFNRNGKLETSASWNAPNSYSTQEIAPIDVDGDGDLDLSIANCDQSSRIYINTGNGSNFLPNWISGDSPSTLGVTWGDVDLDGQPDLITANCNTAPQLYFNRSIQTNATSRSLQQGVTNISVDLLGSTVPTFGGQTTDALAPSELYALPAIRQDPVVTLTYVLNHPSSESFRAVRAYYSLDGGFSGPRENWKIAIPTASTPATNLQSAPYPLRNAQNTHSFGWDVLASAFFGQSDDVVVRIEALPSFTALPNSIPGPFLFPYVVAQTYPFRVRSNQVRVIEQATGQAEPDAIVFRAASNQSAAQPYRDLADQPYRTDGQGYLQGRGELALGDSLVALWPDSRSEKYTVYHSNATPNPTTIEPTYVQQLGVQTLTVSSQKTLILFDLIVSLEWDARNDPTYILQLENDIKRTSQILFDLSNGQAALGKVSIYHDKGNWGLADIVITANNNQRPSSIIGGVVTTATNDVGVSGIITDAYVPGQLRIGANWNRFGNPSGTLGEDWPRVLAHELGHYLFFLSDNYVGVTPDKKAVKLVDCRGSSMTDPYEENYSEWLGRAEWTGECLDTLAETYLGRADWQTVKQFYPMLNDAADNPGPNQLPLDVTEVTLFAPPTVNDTLAAPFFPLIDESSATVVIPDGRGQGYLLKRQGNSDPTDDYLIALGSPIGDLMQARGASPGDRLCIFDYSQADLGIGCLDSMGSTATPIQIRRVVNWQPQVQVSGMSSNTVAVTVTGVTDVNLSVQLLPALGVASSEVPMSKSGADFVQNVTASDGAYYGFVRIFVPGSNPHKELIVEFNTFEEWGGKVRFWATPTDAWGGKVRFWAAPSYSWGGKVRFWGAPVMSSDGQVSIFALDNPFANAERYTLQTVTPLPLLPSWLTPVGQAYRLSGGSEQSANAILLNYLTRDVPDGYEETLRVYYLADGQSLWQPLPTELDTYRNAASAQVPGSGIYLLMATSEVRPQLSPGWNNIGYSVQATQTVSNALASIQNSYSIIYAYEPSLTNPWLSYDPSVPSPFSEVVNTLKSLEPGHGYWLYATEAITLYFDVTPSSYNLNLKGRSANSTTPNAPAIYYGTVAAYDTFVPQIGTPVWAEMNGVRCSETTVQPIADQLGYVLYVPAKGETSLDGCGTLGSPVSIKVGILPETKVASWDNSKTHRIEFNGDSDENLYSTYLPHLNR